MKKLYAGILGGIFCLILLAGGLGLLLLPRERYSEAERRPLAEVPALTGKAVASGRFSAGAETWAADHFPGREFFRGLKTRWELDLLRQPESSGLARVEGSLMKLEKEIRQSSLDYAAGRFRALYESYLEASDCRIFCAVIPDKSHYLAERGYPVLDLARMETLLQEALPGAEPIRLADTLRLEDYYRTDSHWRQERLLPAAARLLSALGRSTERLEAGGFETRSCGLFTGVYAGQSALNPPPEEIFCLAGGPIAECRALDPETREPVPLYDPEGCDPRDRYTLFLGGARGLLRLENPAVTEPGELIVFRDSFASSLAPLLCAEYRTVILVDLRYAAPSVLGRYLRFTDQDVLFLFSATLLNQSQGLR